MPSAPYDQIRALYAQDPTLAMTWEELVGWHLADPLAYVIKEPEFFVMGRAVPKAARPEDIRDLRVRFPVEQCDAWHCFAFAGDMRKGFRALPYNLPWICWERYTSKEKELQFVSTASIRRHVT